MNQTINLKFDIELDEIRVLSTDVLTCLYSHGKLRYIRRGEEELLRMVYTAVRDADWNTAPYTVSDEKINQSENGFRVSYTADYRMNEISYRSKIIIDASGGRIEFRMEGEALSNFNRNRIGICVLHPIPSTAGRPMQITMPNGESYNATFPFVISPHQPVKDIRKMSWSTGVSRVHIQFEGDVFETEDQRNWTDSSFKTYSTPLDLPKPVQVKKGESMHQTVVVTVTPDESQSAEAISGVEVQPPSAFPLLGYSKVPKRKLHDKELEQLRSILFDHYRVELDLTGDDWKEELSTAVAEVRQLDTKLHLTCFFSESFDSELIQLFDVLPGIDHLVYSILVLDKKSSRTVPDSYKVVYDRLKREFPSIKLGYGTNNHFADLNRNLPADVQYDFVSFGVTPQAHSTDTLSLLENLDNQLDNINTIRHHLGEVEVHISPLTFKGRKPSLYPESEKPADYDERQHTAFGAAWIIKALKNFAGTNITLFDAVGYKGILADKHLHDGTPTPLFDIMQQLKSFRPEQFAADGGINNIVLENGMGERLSIEFDEMFETVRTNGKP